MTRVTWIKTRPGAPDFNVFREVVNNVYSPNSPRFVLGNEPVNENLEGCYVMLENERPAGRFAFYENPELLYNNQKAACFGSYECADNTRLADALFKKLFELAKVKGYKQLIGPMEGSTWNNYRFNLNNDKPPFFMEPFHHLYYNHQLTIQGFQVLATYFSKRDNELNIDEKRMKKFDQYYRDKGAVIRSLNMDQLDKELAKIGAFSKKAFAGNFLYTPFTEDQFVSKYLKYKNYFNPDFVIMVEDKSQEIRGFIFAIQDYFDTSGKTAMIKTIACHEEFEFRGLGSYLSQKFELLVKKKGFTKVIHAFMHAENNSMLISQKLAKEEYRKYALYIKKIP